MAILDLISRSIKNEAPKQHYTMKIVSFSSLKSDNKYESREFEAGGYKWKLVLFPNGNKNRNVDDHISLYIETGGKKAIKPGRIVIVNYKLFLLNQHKERRTYLLEDEKHCINRTIVGGLAGFDRFIPLEDFSNASNGYLIDDTCEFGAEVFVFERRKGSGEHVYMNLNTVTYKHIWKVTKFSKKNASFYHSKPFTDHKYCTWRLELHPKGCRIAKVSKYLSLFLQLEKPYLPTGSKVLVEVTLRILDQIHGKHHSHKAEVWLSGPYWNCGFLQFITEEANARFLKNDNCIIEAEITIAGMTIPGISRP